MKIKLPLLVWGFLGLTCAQLSFAQSACPSGSIITNPSGQTCGISSSFIADSAIIANGSDIASITNSGTITSAYTGTSGPSDPSGIFNNARTIGLIMNNVGGLITAISSSGNNGPIEPSGIFNNGGTITTIFNAGSIVSTGGSNNNGPNAAYGIFNNGGNINQIINTGNISATTGTTTLGSNEGATGLYGNGGTIGRLINGQGGSGATANQTALTYSGTLAANYNIIVSSPTHYGQLSVSGSSGSMSFGIFSGGTYAGQVVAASSLTKGTYASVLTGINQSNITGSTAGNYNGFTWRLNNSSGSIWDLIVTGASTADTQQSLVNTSAALQNAFTLQNTVLANSFSYDCNVFGANDVCVSAGGRNTQVSAANGLNNTSALLIAAYRVMPSVRIGAYADQNLSVNNAGSTVNLGNNTPLIGLFGAWNERLDGTGTEVKISAAYGQKNTTVTRQVVGTSEAGSGSSNLNSQGAQVTAKYGFGIVENVIVSPYVGMRYTQNNMNGYAEVTSASVTAPLTYSALNTNATTALAGVGASYRFIPQAAAFASAGVETDTNTNNGAYSATGITGLTPINFNANPVRTRPTATVGAYYDVEKNQRVGITGIYRQEPYQAVQTTSVMATYTVGL